MTVLSSKTSMSRRVQSHGSRSKILRPSRLFFGKNPPVSCSNSLLYQRDLGLISIWPCMKNEVFLSSGVNFLRIDFASFEVIGSPKQDLIFEPSQTIRILL